MTSRKVDSILYMWSISAHEIFHWYQCLVLAWRARKLCYALPMPFMFIIEILIRFSKTLVLPNHLTFHATNAFELMGSTRSVSVMKWACIAYD